jgi:hypothetical protein
MNSRPVDFKAQRSEIINPNPNMSNFDIIKNQRETKLD